jgi:hypothetical protein
MEENATQPRNILLLRLQQATAQNKIAGSLMLKKRGLFRDYEDDVLNVGQYMYAKETRSGSAAYS